MNRQYHTVVIGLGAMGSAALHYLAKDGTKVLGVDRFRPPHVHGSTHGDTRITRLAIGEGESFTPLAMRSHELWREMEAATGRRLLECVGGLIVADPDEESTMHGANFFGNTLRVAEAFGIPHEILDAAALRRRFPAMRCRGHEIGYFEPSAGFLRPEACVQTHLDLAVGYGAEMRLNETVLGIEPTAGGVRVRIGDELVEAGQAVVTAGPWLPKLMPPLAERLRILPQTMYWFDVGEAYERFRPENLPVFIRESQGLHMYGFPAIDGPSGGFKVATEQLERTVDPDGLRPPTTEADIRHFYEKVVAPYFDGPTPKCIRTASCLYTVTPDFRFIIERMADFPQVIVASPCSGHGFKHSAAIGERLAALAVEG